MRLKKWLGAITGVSFLLLGGGLSARADADYDLALSKAPLGISVHNVFTPGETANNHAQVVDTTNPDAPGTEAVKVTDSYKQFGTIWSTDDNTFDLTKNQTASMWMYFGNKRKKAADGMALVLQNDDRGLAATPKYGKYVMGETLGVWAVDNDKYLAEWVSEVAKKGIQNSWALEFDTHLNDSNNYQGAGNGSAFDAGIKGPHIASNYPGHGDAYRAEKVWNALHTSSRWVTTKKHLGLIEGASDFEMLANAQWHHVTVHWDATAQQITYNFGDKDPHTGNDLTGESRTVDIDLDKIDPDKTGKARWGFTGATGDEAANNLVIFETVPGLVEVDAKSTLTNTTTDHVVKDGETIMGKDKVKLDYDLTYTGGKQDWQDVTARLKLPTDLDYSKITIDYANGKSESVAVDEIQNHKLTHDLAYDLSPENPTAKITLTGQASDPKKVVEVDTQSSSFGANNGVVTTDTSFFKINPKVDIALDLTSDKAVSVDAGETTTITGLVQILENIGLTNEDLTLHPTVNGDKQVTVKVDATDEAVGKTAFTPEVGDLKTGENTVDLYVTDIYGNQSNTVTVDLTVNGDLTFGTVATQSSFKNTELTGATQDVKRTNDWDVQILDTRQAGSQWHLQVAATDFTTESGKRLSGSLVYRDGDSRTTINGSPTTITTGTAKGGQHLTDVTDSWNDTTGLELTVGGAAAKGSYSADITWTLNDTPT